MQESLQAADGHRTRRLPRGAGRKPRGALVVLQDLRVNTTIRAAPTATRRRMACHRTAMSTVSRAASNAATRRRHRTRTRAERRCSNDHALLDIAERSTVRSAGKVAVIGYCWGGTLAWLAACRQPGLSAAVSYYGGGIGELVDLTPRCPVLAHFGERDASIPLSVPEALRTAHPEVEIHIYPAGHGFNCDQRGSFDAPSAKLARERSLAFLKTHA